MCTKDSMRRFFWNIYNNFYFVFAVQYISTLYIPDFAMTHGIPGHLSALLVSIIGATNTLGRFISGFIVDFLHIRSITMYFLAFAVASVGTFFLPFCVTFWQIAMYSVVSGLCVGKFRYCINLSQPIGYSGYKTLMIFYIRATIIMYFIPSMDD